MMHAYITIAQCQFDRKCVKTHSVLPNYCRVPSTVGKETMTPPCTSESILKAEGVGDWVKVEVNRSHMIKEKPW